jgi:FkbM family methyltransferase
MVSNNIFEGGVKNTFRKIFGIWRLKGLMPSFLTKYVIKAAFKKSITEEGKIIYYYYLVLLNSNGGHLSRNDNKFYFHIGDLFMEARSGQIFSDLEVLNQIFGREEYMEIVKLYNDHFDGIPEVIFDIGANVGYASLYFKRHYPNAKIIAVEPDTQNYLVLKSNFENNDFFNFLILNKGVWNKDTYLEPTNLQASLGSWAYTFKETEDITEIEAVDLSQLIYENSGDKLVDILKIDIEGSEEVLFRDNTYMQEVLSNTRVIAIEIHDRLADRDIITKQLRSAGFALSDRGDMTYGINQNLANQK